MEKSIQQIAVEMVEEVTKTLFKNGISNIGETIQQLAGTVKATVLNIVSEAIREMDQALVTANKARKEDGLRIKERNVPRTLLTDLGELRYERTYFETVEGRRCYLADHLIGVEAYERLTKELCSTLVQEAADSSMKKAAANVGVGISRQTVNNKVLALKEVAVDAVRVDTTPKELHLFADEDHVHLQSGHGVIVPLVTVTEGIDASRKRHKTINAVHFEGYGIENRSFFEGISAFLYERYNMEKVEHIYLHADGGKWIQAATDYIPNITMVMDGFHLEKRFKKIGRLQGAAAYMGKIRKAIRENAFERFVASCAALHEKLDEQEQTALVENMNFIQNHWEAIVCRMENEVCGSCTEPLIRPY